MLEAGVPGHHVLDLLALALVIVGRAEADPQLGEVGADDLLAGLGAGDVRAEFLHHGFLAHLLADDLDVLAQHVDAGARLGDPVHQKVVLLELRQVLFLQLEPEHAHAT